MAAPVVSQGSGLLLKNIGSDQCEVKIRMKKVLKIWAFLRTGRVGEESISEDYWK